jgi:glutamate synthase domain-containing protein 3
MSGGIAYVLDDDGTFSTRCNIGMVELGPLGSAEETKRVHALIVRHHQYTGSKLAERILADWDSYAAKFVKVLPTEYRAVLERQHLGTNNDMARLAAV